MYNYLENERRRNLTKLKEKGLTTINCQLCGFECRRLNIHLRKQHKLTEAAYKEQFPTAPLYASDFATKAGETRSQSYKTGKVTCYRTGRTAATCDAIKRGAEALSRVKQGKRILHMAGWNKGLPSWNSELPVNHPYRLRMSKLGTDRLPNVGNTGFRFRPDLGMWFRSRTEANLARIFRLESKPFEYEQQTFELEAPDGSKVLYTPDFLDTTGFFFRGYIEIKGYERQSLRKWVLLRKQLDIPIVCIYEASKVWRVIHSVYSRLIPEWEFHKTQPKSLVRFEGDLETARRYIGGSLMALYQAQGNTEATCESRESVETARAATPLSGVEDTVRSCEKSQELSRNAGPVLLST